MSNLMKSGFVALDGATNPLFTTFLLGRFLPFEGAFQQAEEGYGAKPGCNQNPGSFFVHGCSP
jgi:hypothetical protein